jgi:hypothetical protein
MKLLIMHFLQHPVASSLFGPNILLSNLFSNTLVLYSLFNVRDQISYSYKTTGKIRIFCNWINYYFRELMPQPTDRQDLSVVDKHFRRKPGKFLVTTGSPPNWNSNPGLLNTK